MYDKSKFQNMKRDRKGFLYLSWYNMQGRETGRIKNQTGSFCGGYGKGLVGREEYIVWGLSRPEFNKLWWDYVASKFDFKLTPTPDRIDNDKGYSLDNMQWITLSQNSRKNGGSNCKMRTNKTGFIGVKKVGRKWQSYTTKDSKQVSLGFFDSAEKAAKVRDNWVRAYRGQHAVLNFPEE
jgi:hypothetical protein